jgi:hypothetical protein
LGTQATDTGEDLQTICPRYETSREFGSKYGVTNREGW